MNIYAGKTRQNKKELVSYYKPQNHRDGKSLFQLTDNRPETVVQQVLHETANHSLCTQYGNLMNSTSKKSPVDQSKQIQKMANTYSEHQQKHLQNKLNITGQTCTQKKLIENISGMSPQSVRAQKPVSREPVQLAPLNNAKLNLVGESHNKNAQRRNAEKGYANATGGGNYWTEKGFTYGAGNRRGDPDNLIIGYRIDRVKRHIDDLESSYNISDVRGMINYCNRLPNDFNNASKFPDQGKQAPMLSALSQLKKLAQGLKDSWDKDHSDPVAWQSLIRQKMLFIKPQYQQLNKKYEAITKRNTERDAIDARYARSDAMWIGAATGKKKGLWMVGQNHIADIIKLHNDYDGEGTYKKLRAKFAQQVKMQNKTDFETEFQVWWTQNEGSYPR